MSKAEKKVAAQKAKLEAIPAYELRKIGKAETKLEKLEAKLEKKQSQFSEYEVKFIAHMNREKAGKDYGNDSFDFNWEKYKANEL